MCVLVTLKHIPNRVHQVYAALLKKKMLHIHNKCPHGRTVCISQSWFETLLYVMLCNLFGKYVEITNLQSLTTISGTM